MNQTGTPDARPNGLQVSVSYDFWAAFGVKEGLCSEDGIEKPWVTSRSQKCGVNLFDNAEVYGSPRGAAERIMGEAIRRLQAQHPDLWRRSDIHDHHQDLLGGDGVTKGAKKAHHGRTDAALARLQLDYVDLFLSSP